MINMKNILINVAHVFYVKLKLHESRKAFST